jgi:hypothetical protein
MRVHGSLCKMTNGGFLLECHCGELTEREERIVALSGLTHEDWCEDPNCHHRERP